MLCDGCEEVSLHEGLAYGDCMFCCEACFEDWFAAPRAAQRDVAPAAPLRARPEARTTLKLVAVTVVAAGAVLMGRHGAQAATFAPAFAPAPVTTAALCHKRRIVGGERKRVTVRCGRSRFHDPRPARI